MLTSFIGLAYTWNSPLIDRWKKQNVSAAQEASRSTIDRYIQPLIFEPGTRHRYSVGIDWAGILVSRVLGRTLEEVFQENIFQPCGVTSLTFHPTTQVKDHLMGMCERVPVHTGEIKLLKGTAMGRTMNPDDYGPIYSGGGGLFGTARDYLTVLRHVLASADPDTKQPLISQQSFKALFTDHLDSVPEIREDLAKMAHDQHVHDPAILSEGTGMHIGHSPGLFLNMIDSKHGRKAMAGFWDGAAKTAMWLDPTTGIAVNPRITDAQQRLFVAY